MAKELTCGSCVLGSECHYAFVGFEKTIPELVLIQCKYDDEFYHCPESPCWFPERIQNEKDAAMDNARSNERECRLACLNDHESEEYTE